MKKDEKKVIKTEEEVLLTDDDLSKVNAAGEAIKVISDDNAAGIGEGHKM